MSMKSIEYRYKAVDREGRTHSHNVLVNVDEFDTRQDGIDRGYAINGAKRDLKQRGIDCDPSSIKVKR